MKLIPAAKKNEELVAEMDALLNDETSFYLWWLGQSGYLLQWNSQRVLIDPYLSDSLSKKYANTDKPHIRMSDRVIDPERLRRILAVTSSHNHTDHLDTDSLLPLFKNNPGISMIIPEANRTFVCERLGCAREFPIGLSDGQSVRVGDFSFLGIPAKHNELERDGQGNPRFMGYVISFGKYRIYHSGDTLWFDGMEALLKPLRVDVAILPINGNLASRNVAGNLSCHEAAQLGKAIGAGCIIPCHYDMFTFNTADVLEFAKEAEKIHQPYKILTGGSRFRLA